MDEMRGIARAVPVMAEASHARLTRALAATSVPAPADAARHAELCAARDALLGLMQ